MSNVLNEMADALTDPKRPVQNAISIGAVEMWNQTRNPMWIKVWIYLNSGSYSTIHTFTADMIEVFDL